MGRVIAHTVTGPYHSFLTQRSHCVTAAVGKVLAAVRLQPERRFDIGLFPFREIIVGVPIGDTCELCGKIAQMYGTGDPVGDPKLYGIKKPFFSFSV
jgi:hypothetical protein